MEEEEEEVFLPNTELAKYVDGLNVLGHIHDRTDEYLPKSYGINETGIPGIACPNFGFICGRNLNLVQFKPFLTIVNAFYIVLDLLKRRFLKWKWCQNIFDGGWILLARIRLKLMFDDVLIGLEDRIPETYAFKWRNNNHRQTYSLEQCLVKGNGELSSYGKTIDTMTSRLKLTISGLTTLQFNVEAQRRPFLRHSTTKGIHEAMNSRKKIVHEICKNSDRLIRTLEEVSYLLQAQSKALDRFLFETRINFDTPLLTSKPENPGVHEEEESREEIDLSPLIFETNELPTKVIETDPYIFSDEIFELEVKDGHPKPDDLVKFDTGYEVSEEVKREHAELLSQLHTTLLMRRAKMKEREEQAYVKMYGRLPKEDTEEIEHSSCSPKPAGIKYPILEEFTSSSGDCGDELVECENEGVRSDFSSFLQNLLQKKVKES